MDHRRKKEITVRRAQIYRLVELKNDEIERLRRQIEELDAEYGELWEELRAAGESVEAQTVTDPIVTVINPIVPEEVDIELQAANCTGSTWPRSKRTWPKKRGAMAMDGKYAGTFEIRGDDVHIDIPHSARESELAKHLLEIQRVNNLAYAIADALAPELVISDAVPTERDGEIWYDVESLDAEEEDRELAYCEARELLRHHPDWHNLVQVKGIT